MVWYPHLLGLQHGAQGQVRGNLGQVVPSLGAGIKYQWFVDIEVQFTTSRMLKYHQSPDPVDLLAACNSHRVHRIVCLLRRALNKTCSFARIWYSKWSVEQLPHRMPWPDYCWNHSISSMLGTSLTLNLCNTPCGKLSRVSRCCAQWSSNYTWSIEGAWVDSTVIHVIIQSIL